MDDPAHRPAAATEDSLEVWFQRIFNQIDFVERQIDRKEGFLFFSTHVYSEEELFSSPAFETISSTVGQIENLFDMWTASSAISDDRRKFYWDGRLKIERRLGELRARIVDRKPTFWESIIQSLSRFIRFVMTHLPLLPQVILDRIGYALTGDQRRIKKAIIIDPDEV